MAVTPDQLGQRKRDDTVPKNFIDDVDPTANDDEGDGFSVMSMWTNTATPSIWICFDASSGSAIWLELMTK